MEKDELAGVGLAFYAQIYVLKVPIAHGLRLRPIAPTTTTARLALATSALTTTPRPLALVRSAGVQDEGRG